MGRRGLRFAVNYLACAGFRLEPTAPEPVTPSSQS